MTFLKYVNRYARSISIEIDLLHNIL